MTPAAGGAGLAWRKRDDRTWSMNLDDRGAEWIEVRRSDVAAEPSWRVDSRLCGGHYKLGEAFGSLEAAQGCALLLAMRLLPTRRSPLHAALDVVPGAWWWKIAPGEDDASEHRAIFSGRTADSAESAERSGRAAGAGWWLFVYGPGSVKAFGQLPR
jgi:hypothetical protein